MPDRAVIPFAPAVLEGNHLLIFALFDDFGRYFSAGGNLIPVEMHQELESGCFAGFDVQKIDVYRVALCDTILPSTSLDNCVSHKRLSGEKKPRNVTQLDALGKPKRW